MVTSHPKGNAVLRLPGKLRGARTTERRALETLAVRGLTICTLIRRSVSRDGRYEELVMRYSHPTNGTDATLRCTYAL